MNAQVESKMISDAEEAFQEFDKNVNEALKQNEAVEAEILKDLNEQNEQSIRNE